MSVIERIAAQRVLPVLRCTDVEDAVETARACGRAGMEMVELTRSIPQVEAAVRQLRDDGLAVGVGTLTSASEVSAAVAAGAQFLVSFAAPKAVMLSARRAGVPVIPGALTPSEVFDCFSAGATTVKIFPARLVTPSYVSDLAAVMPELRTVATGGIAPTAEAIGPWLAAGALAVGIGAALGRAEIDGVDEVERRARVALDAASAPVVAESSVAVDAATGARAPTSPRGRLSGARSRDPRSRGA
jgi:2-dehydro-3-deoxyphosphogluconate aldolase/(4S)-4-hydroxy-2-oxoglutarate aldolase